MLIAAETTLSSAGYTKAYPGLSACSTDIDSEKKGILSEEVQVQTGRYQIF